MNIQVECDTSSFCSSSQPISMPASSPNTSLQSRGSDQKLEFFRKTSGSFFQNPDNVKVAGGQFNSSSGPHVTINLTREQVPSGPRCVLRLISRYRTRGLLGGTDEQGMWSTLFIINVLLDILFMQVTVGSPPPKSLPGNSVGQSLHCMYFRFSSLLLRVIEFVEKRQKVLGIYLFPLKT